MKKFVKLATYLAIPSALFFSFFYFISPSQSLPSYCAFCNQKVLEYQTFYEDELIAALYSYKPVTSCHLLVIPKRHVERFENLTTDELLQMNRVIKKVDKAARKIFGTSSYLLLQKNGVEVGQTVPHVHFHYIARKKGQNGAVKFLLGFFLSPLLPQVKKKTMHEMVFQLQKEMRESVF